MSSFAVVGGGLSGLVAARTLRKLAPDVEISLYEASDRLGGKIHTSTIDDIRVELGADSFLTREPWAVDLCTELGLADELIAPAVYGAQIWIGDSLFPLPPGFLRGVPNGVGAAFRSKILSPGAALRTGVDLVWPRKLRGPDVSLGDFVEARFGKQVLDRLVDPVLAGTRAGVSKEISLAAAAPEIDSIARENNSVFRGLKKTRARGRLESGPPPFMSLRGGLSRLIDRLAEDLTDVEVHLSAPVHLVDREGNYVQIALDDRRDRVNGAVITTPAHVTVPMIERISPHAAEEMRSIEYSSGVAITHVYPAGSATLPEGSGLLVPSSENRLLSAATWFSRKWPHHAPADGRSVVRCYVGRAGRAGVLEKSDTELMAATHDELAGAVPIEARPLTSRVTRWDDALPQYSVGHKLKVARIEAALSERPIVLAGAGFRGSGIPDCIKQGQDAAQALFDAEVGSGR